MGMTTKAENAAITQTLVARKASARERITSGKATPAPKPEPIKTRPARKVKTADELKTKTRGTSRKVTKPKPARVPKTPRVYKTEVETLKAKRMLVKWAAIRADRVAAKLPDGPEKDAAVLKAANTWAEERVAYAAYKAALVASKGPKVVALKDATPEQVAESQEWVDSAGEIADEAAVS